eukprot:CAMPEP_0113478232 /NCGR_PEP_ID=MMETSP0014_2-20120614/20642_1 /TAXON_ID=2857 /ORGANISM="Nitzschia sp." /LENGTH=141 /DNA_ID=CAMNT_0000371401 /DNA_START=238 /DNA_END=663 /DNA_ORIENTATION=- /assembly_acc=CAM_ASM_000159
MAVTPLGCSSVKPPGRIIVYVGCESFGSDAYSARTSSSPLIFSSMILPKMFKNLKTGESGLLTDPDETMTRWGTLHAIHAFATLTKPSLSTCAGVPPVLDADAAKMTARVPSIADWIVDGSVTSHTIGRRSDELATLSCSL